MIMGSLSDALRGGFKVSKEKRSLEDLFEEEPPSLTEFVQGRNYLNSPPLSEVQYEAVLHAERIFYPDVYPLMAEQMDPYWGQYVRPVNFVDLQWGKGAGKDHVSRVISLRVANLLLCLRSPQAYYGLPNQDYVHLLNVASSAPQANRAFFKPMTHAVSRGWFADKAQPTQNAIEYAKQVMAISGHSDAETQEGLNLLLGVADEIDAFKSAVTARSSGGNVPLNSVEDILDMLRSSASTRFPGRTEDEPPVFKNVRISYPRYVNSPIQRLTNAARRDNELQGPRSRRYVSGPLPTWEVNPRVHGKEAFADEYREDPVMARAKYECDPARAINPYFRNTVQLRSRFTTSPNPLQISGYTLNESSWVPEYHFHPALVPRANARYAVHVDLAISGDAAGIAMAHVARWEEVTRTQEDERGNPTTAIERRPHVVVDFCFSYTSDITVSPAREIQVRWARWLVFELIRRGFDIRFFSADNFQSTDTLQILESRGIETAKVSTDRTDEVWKNLRDLLYEDRITIPDNPDLADELEGLDRLPNGKVDHSPSGSKDLADACGGAAQGAVYLGGEEGETRSYYAEGGFEVGGSLDVPEGLTDHVGADGGGLLTWMGPRSGFDTDLMGDGWPQGW